MGYSPRGRKESDTTQLFHFTALLLRQPLAVGMNQASVLTIPKSTLTQCQLIDGHRAILRDSDLAKQMN